MYDNRYDSNKIKIHKMRKRVESLEKENQRLIRDIKAVNKALEVLGGRIESLVNKDDE